MVLSTPRGAGLAGAPGSRPPPPAGGERGSQTLEFALSLPIVVLWLCVVIHAALLCSDLVVAQTLAREAARAAAVSDDATVERTLAQAAGRRPVRLRISPRTAGRGPDDLVTADLEVRSRAFAALGVTVWIPARATMRVEVR